MGLIVGLLVGLALALGVALYVTKVPVPFLNKVHQRSAEQDAAEIEKNKNWDPNGPLQSKPGTRPGVAPNGVALPAPSAAKPALPVGATPAASGPGGATRPAATADASASAAVAKVPPPTSTKPGVYPCRPHSPARRDRSPR